MSAAATATGTPRASWLDAARGIAVLAMVVYHLSWDLSHFGVISADVASDVGWRLFAQAIAAAFLTIAGVGLAFATRQGVDWPAFAKRLGIIAGAAALVTVATRMMFPDRFIYFGILHCIAVSSVLALAFLRLPVFLIGLAGVAVILLRQIVDIALFSHPALVWLGLSRDVPPSNDFEPIFPWFGWMLLGLALGRSGLLLLGSGAGGSLAKIGRWSLVIYLLHQPILFNGVGEAVARGLLRAPAGEARFVSSCAGSCSVSGLAAETCVDVCRCTLASAEAEGIWPRQAAGRASTGDGEKLARIGQACLAKRENSAIQSPKP